MKNIKLKTKNILIFYNIITIFKYFIINKDILYVDFKIDFILINILIYLFITLYNNFD